MAAASLMYGINLRDALDATNLALNYEGDAFKMALETNSFTPTQSMSVYADITNELAASGGYSSGGAAVGSQTFTLSSDILMFDAADTAWTSATFSAVRQRTVYDNTLGSKNMGVQTDFGADFGVTSGTFTVVESANGIWRIDVTP